MTKNVGTADRLIRLVLVVAAVVLWATGVASGTLGIVVLVIGAGLLVSGLTGFCPAYVPLGISTIRKR